MQHLRDRSAAGPIRAVAARTRDVIDAVATICRVRGVPLANDGEIDALGIRLEIGLPPQLADLAGRLGSLLTRANYLDLLANGLSDVASLKQAPQDQLISLLGEQTALALRGSLEPNEGDRT
jgi:hypothetical protein